MVILYPVQCLSLATRNFNAAPKFWVMLVRFIEILTCKKYRIQQTLSSLATRVPRPVTLLGAPPYRADVDRVDVLRPE